MRILALAVLLLALVAFVPGGAARPNPVWIHPEPKTCVTEPCEQYYCDTLDESNGAVRHERFRDCSERFSIDTIDCIFGEHWETYTVGLVTVRYSACNQP